LTFFDNALDAFELFVARRLSDTAKDLFQPRDLLFGFLKARDRRLAIATRPVLNNSNVAGSGAI
jgi:hypothetical protein